MKRGGKPKQKPQKRNAAVIREAVLAMQSGMSYRAASRYYGIPHTTLFNYRRSNENYDLSLSAVAESSTTKSITPEPTEIQQQTDLFDKKNSRTPKTREDHEIEPTEEINFVNVKMSPVSSPCSDDEPENNTFEEYVLHCSDIYSGLRPKDTQPFTTVAATTAATTPLMTTLPPSTTLKLIPQIPTAEHTVNGRQSIIQNVDAFTNYIKLEMYNITDEELQDDLHNKIQSLIFEYKNKQRVLSRQNQ